MKIGFALYRFFYSFWFSEGIANDLGIRIVPSERNLAWFYFQRNFRGGELVSFNCTILVSYLVPVCWCLHTNSHDFSVVIIVVPFLQWEQSKANTSCF